MNKLLKKYKESNITTKECTLREIEENFENKYLAKVIVDNPTYFDLNDDPMVDVCEIVKMYEIADSNILSGLFSDEERRIQKVLGSEAFLELPNKIGRFK